MEGDGGTVDSRDLRCQYGNTCRPHTLEKSGEMLRAPRTARAEFRV